MLETGDPYTFEDVATCLCKGAPPNQKLAQHFRRWARPMKITPGTADAADDAEKGR